MEDVARGQLVLPYAFGSDPTCTSASSGCLDRIAAARSADGGATWKQEDIAQLPSGSGLTTAFGTAADDRGQEYVAYGSASGGSPVSSATNDAHVWLTASASRGAGWSRPRRLDPPGWSAMMPWVVAGRNGLVDVAYYATPTPDGQLASVPWYVYLAKSTDGGRTLRTTRLSDLAYLGSAAAHMPKIWDLLGLALDDRGRAHIAWTSIRGTNANSPIEIMYARELP